MLSEFKAFIAKGNVLGLAVAVIIAGAFGIIVAALISDVIMPLVGAAFGGPDFSNLFIRLGPIPEGYAGSIGDYAALKTAGVPVLGYGAFLTAVVNFVILAFIVFMIVRSANRIMPKKPVAAAPEDIVLLREIRDALKKYSPTSAPDLRRAQKRSPDKR